MRKLHWGSWISKGIKQISDQKRAAQMLMSTNDERHGICTKLTLVDYWNSYLKLAVVQKMQDIANVEERDGTVMEDLHVGEKS